MKDCLPPDPVPVQPVRVSRRPVDWEVGDPWDASFRWLSDLTFRGIKALGQGIRKGCHFVNPRFTVSCREPTAAFFREALNRRGSWLRTFRHSLGNRAPRELAKILGCSGRQTALSGVMFIAGSPIPPRTWQAMADKLLDRGTTPKISTIRRRVDLPSLNATGDAEPLKAVSLIELQARPAANPDVSLFVAPGITGAAPSSPAGPS